ncbi:MAG: hypothetical protein ACE5ER_11000 [Nitrospinaceae bacterium]
MRRCAGIIFTAVVWFLVSTGGAWAQAGGHASVGLGHGEEGYLHLQEMVKHLEFSLQMEDASPELKQHVGAALTHAREALKHYDEALMHANEALGRQPRNPMAGGEGSPGPEGSAPGMGMPYGGGGPPMGRHEEGSH